MIYRSSVIPWLFVAVLSCFFTVCGFLSIAEAKEFKVGTWKTAQTIQPYVYEKFIGSDDKIRVFSFTNPSDQRMALVAGSLDMCGTTIAHAIHAASRGEPVVIVSSLCNKCSALVVGKDSPIEDPGDLKGKKIGYVPGTMHEILLRETLAREGINPSTQTRLMRVDFFDMGTALARGSIDAFLSGEPFPTIAVVKGYGRILSYPYYDESVGSINAGMIVTRETIEKDPKNVMELVRAHAKATDYLNQNKGEWLKKASEFGTPLEILKKAEPNMELVWNMDKDFVKKSKALGKRMEALGLITKQPDYNKLFDLSFVSKID